MTEGPAIGEAEALHHLGEREPRKRSRQINADKSEDAREQTFDQSVDLVWGRKAHFNIELGKFGLAIGARGEHGFEFAEAFEICEYGTRPDEAMLRRLFPFFPKR